MKTYDERTLDVLERVEKLQAAKSPKLNRVFFTRLGIVAAAIAFIIALNVTLFLPYPTVNNIAAYKDSQYYPLISVVNDLTYRKPQYKNNFEKIIAGIKSMFKFDGFGSPPIASAPSIGDSSMNYRETTNNQVSGIIEGDLLKRSTEYCYYFMHEFSRHALKIYRPDGADIALVGSLKIVPDDNTILEGYMDDTKAEMYLSADCTKVIIVAPCYFQDTNKTNTCVIQIDVTDAENPVELGRTYVSGSYVSSRLVGDSLLLFTNLTVGINPDFSDDAAYLPQTGSSPDNMTSMPIEDIIYSDDAQDAQYTIVCDIDVQTLDIYSHLAFLSYSEQVYVSAENIYLTSSKKKNIEFDDGIYYDVSSGLHVDTDNINLPAGKYCKSYVYTDISRISYGADGLGDITTFTTEGEVLNQYSMDEYNGTFRVAVTSYNVELSVFGDEGNDGIYGQSVYTSASLYVYDLDTLEMLGSVVNFAPAREKVRSARFDGDTIYVCTAYVTFNMTVDPVYMFDVSDVGNITQKDTGTITGYSTSLTKFSHDTLLGIGIDDNRRLKIELYRETEDGLESVDVYIGQSIFTDNYKSYFIDAERGIIGFGTIVEYVNVKMHYILLTFDGESLTVEIYEYAPASLLYYNTRTAYIDGYLYVFCSDTAFSIEYDV